MIVPGALELRLGLGASPLTASHTANEETPEGQPIEVWHRQKSFIMDVRLSADLGLTDNLALVVELPLRLFDTRIRYEDLDGNEVSIANGDVHHRNETLFGLGDPLVGVRLGWRLDAWTFGGSVGLRLPLGHTEPNPYTPASSVLPHEHFQFGTGTVDPEINLVIEHDFGDLDLALWGFIRPALYANTHGFQAGLRYAGGLTAASDFGLEGWRFTATLDASTEDSETWDGKPPVDDGNQGRFDLFAGVGISARPSPDLSVGIGLRAPIYSYIVGGQLELPVVVDITVGGTLHLWEDDDDHDHGSTVQGDVADTTVTTPVPGKLTVIDYYAAWCAPCKALAPLLEDLARGHDWLAVRRFDVGDTAPDGMSLPHVEVFDRQGVLIYRGEGDPDTLAADIESIAHGKRPPSRLPATPP